MVKINCYEKFCFARRDPNASSNAVSVPGLFNGGCSGLTGFTARVTRTRLAAQGLTINNLLPGAFDTYRLRGSLQGAATKTGQPLETVMDARRKNTPALRFGTPEKFGANYAFLCSIPAACLTGQNAPADGGAYPAT